MCGHQISIALVHMTLICIGGPTLFEPAACVGGFTIHIVRKGKLCILHLRFYSTVLPSV